MEELLKKDKSAIETTGVKQTQSTTQKRKIGDTIELTITKVPKKTVTLKLVGDNHKGDSSAKAQTMEKTPEIHRTHTTLRKTNSTSLSKKISERKIDTNGLNHSENEPPYTQEVIASSDLSPIVHVQAPTEREEVEHEEKMGEEVEHEEKMGEEGEGQEKKKETTYVPTYSELSGEAKKKKPSSSATKKKSGRSRVYAGSGRGVALTTTTLSLSTTDKSKKKTKSGIEKKKPRTKTSRAGITFPVGRIIRFIKEQKKIERVSVTAGVYMAAVLEYLIAEVIEVSFAETEKKGRSRINPRDIKIGVDADNENALKQLFEDSIIFNGGVIPEASREIMREKNIKKSEDYKIYEKFKKANRKKKQVISTKKTSALSSTKASNGKKDGPSKSSNKKKSVSTTTTSTTI